MRAKIVCWIAAVLRVPVRIREEFWMTPQLRSNVCAKPLQGRVAHSDGGPVAGVL